jgi:hypothetical protein
MKWQTNKVNYRKTELEKSRVLLRERLKTELETSLPYDLMIAAQLEFGIATKQVRALFNFCANVFIEVSFFSLIRSAKEQSVAMHNNVLRN